MKFRAPGRKGTLASETIKGRFADHQPAMMSSQAFRLGGRPIPLLEGALGSAVALVALSLSTGSAQAACDPASPANTCRVTVGGLQYDVTTFLGTYIGETDKFAPPPAPGVMPWWGSSSTASDFAAAVGTGLGAPNTSGIDGPYFGYAVGAVNVNLYRLRNGILGSGAVRKSDTRTYAQATLYAPAPAAAASAPGPLPLFGAAAAFGFSRTLRKRIQGARLPIGSSQPRA